VTNDLSRLVQQEIIFHLIIVKCLESPLGHSIGKQPIVHKRDNLEKKGMWIIFMEELYFIICRLKTWM